MSVKRTGGHPWKCRMNVEQTDMSAANNNKPKKERLSVFSEALNPFKSRLHLTWKDKIKTIVLTFTLFPLRVLFILVCLILAWVLAKIGMLGLSREDLQEKPLQGWRKEMRGVVCLIMRVLFVIGGFNWHLSVKGKQASEKEAPILALAPHSSYFDCLPVVYLGAPSLVAKEESRQVPIFGTLINFTQPIFVRRDDPNSRQNTIRQIVDRATSGEEWPQILIFPEGTCTNRTCLITFKPGAFYPGVPVQPVCIRYPNTLDTVTWTWDKEGPKAHEIWWITLTQFYTRCEIEYLPVYVPSEKEKKDPKLFARNFRAVMAEALGVPAVDYTYEDTHIMVDARLLNIPYSTGPSQFERVFTKLEFSFPETLTVLVESPLLKENLETSDGMLTLSQLAEILGRSPSNPDLVECFSLFDPDGEGEMDYRELAVSLAMIFKPKYVEENLFRALELYSDGGEISAAKLQKCLRYTIGLYVEDSNTIYTSLKSGSTIPVTPAKVIGYLKGNSKYEYLFTNQPLFQETRSQEGDCRPSPGSEPPLKMD